MKIPKNVFALAAEYFFDPFYNLDLLEEIEQLILKTKTDWWTALSESDRKAIDEGLDDISIRQKATSKQKKPRSADQGRVYLG